MLPYGGMIRIRFEGFFSLRRALLLSCADP